MNRIDEILVRSEREVWVEQKAYRNQTLFFE